MSAYVSLRNSADDDSEDKLLEKSSTDDFAPYNTRVPSNRVLVLFYALCALAILFAGANVASGIKSLRHIQAAHGPIDTLPKPDIFVGLPKSPKAPMHMGDAHSHTHDHSHDHN
ncbi:hypothetical protein BJ165DRAFT_1594281 [Panaeolus papilionaceus]|nr:hypothetical protein BJ165DRAFT_1594281 [Panaeolus papilionaceus]